MARPRAAPRAHPAARARAPLQPPERHRRASAPGSGSPRQRWPSPRSRSGRSGSTRARRPPLPVRHGRGRRAARSRSTTGRRRDAARASCASCATTPRAAWREVRFAGSVQARLDGVGVLERDDALRLGAVGPGGARGRRCATTRAPTSPRLSYDGFAPAAPRQPAGDVAARLEMRASSSRRPSSCSTSCWPAGRAGDGGAPRPAGAALGVAAGREPARRRRCAWSSSTAGRIARLHLRTGSYANWPALAHAAAGNLAARLPADQQELRALLRLRGPLHVRPAATARNASAGSAALPRAGGPRSLAVRHVDAGSCNGCEHELSAAANPLLRPAALRPRHRRLAPPRRRPADHRAR